MNCFINLLYFGLMANFTVAPNTTNICSSKDECVTSMCELSHQEDVNLVCFMSDGSYNNDTNILTIVFIFIIVFLSMYSVLTTLIIWCYFKNHY